MKKITHVIMGFLLAAYAAAPTYAFTPLQAPILAAAAVTPNVMVLLDNSGSMDNLIWHSNYDDTATYASVDRCVDYSSRRGCQDWKSVDAAETYYLSSAVQGNCASTGQRLFRYGSTARCLVMPDPVGGGDTRVKGNYIRYLVVNNVADAAIPTDYRMNVARTVTNNIVTQNRGLRYGLFTFNAPVSGGDSGPGGSLQQAVADFSKSLKPDGTVVVTQAQADTNFANFKTKVSAVKSTTNTPLAEAYYEVTRYFRGISRYQGSGSGNYTSPVQYRCQRNFGIVLTDGLPTYDRTFPTDDPLRDNPLVAGGNNLPNWDGNSANDGANLSGNAEGDTLYLDDIAKFAYDSDLRDVTSSDDAGKSYNDPGFKKQNLFTYTVGFAVNNQMLKDAARYGNGAAYTANDSTQLNDSLTKAINEISTKAGSGGSGASSSATLSTTTYYYKTLYDPKDWRGTIEAYLLNPNTGRPLDPKPTWTTDSTITPTSNNATYQTYKTGAGAGVINLDYNLLSSAQQAQLNSSVAAPLTGASLLTWLKGTNVTNLRTRTVLLGDVINSSLERLSPEESLASSAPGDSSYSAYLSSKSAMTSSLLVNGNDGLFHVINAKDGSHRYGYLPSSLLPSLHIVASPTYATSGTHTFMVDGPITVADAQLGSNWATLAVSGMGAGGKNLFAIKLFDGSNNIGALWELAPPATNTPANDWNDLGYSYSKPVVARTQAGKWVAIFGNGYGSYNGKAALYVVNIADGSLVQKIVVDENKTGTAGEIAAGTGLSSPQVVVNAQGEIERIYAGDLRGNLWAFTGSSLSPFKLFAAGSGHPFTAQPLVDKNHPKGGVLVLIGTGKLNEIVDKSDKTRQAFYAIWDKPDNTSTVSISDLLAQSFTREVLVNGETYVETSNTAIDWNVKKGWYLPLVLNNVDQGERVIYKAQTTQQRVIFVTAKVDAADPCESSGSGRLVELDLYSGAKLSYPVLDTNGDGALDEKDSIISGLNINDGLPGSPVILDGGSGKVTQTKIILLSTGQTKTVDEDFNCARGGKCPEEPEEPQPEEPTGTFSGRIMWRQLQ